MNKKILMIILVFISFNSFSVSINVGSPLFIQEARSMKLINSTDGDPLYPYLITLYDINPYIIYFSDRPERFSGVIDIESYLKLWGNEGVNLNANPPNVGMSYLDYDPKTKQNMRTDVVILNDPVYDNETNSMTYKVKPLHSFRVRRGMYKDTILYFEIDQNITLDHS